MFLLLHGPSTSGVRCREPRAYAAQALEDGFTPAVLDQWIPVWSSLLGCSAPCWSEPGPAAPRGTGQPELMKHNSGFKKTPLGRVCGLIFSLLPHPCSYPGCFSAASSSGVKPCIQQTHSVLKFHLVLTYFWDIVALDLGSCEVQKDTGSLAVELNGPGRGMAASSSLPGNAHTEVHSDCCGGPSTV